MRTHLHRDQDSARPSAFLGSGPWTRENSNEANEVDGVSPMSPRRKSPEAGVIIHLFLEVITRLRMSFGNYRDEQKDRENIGTTSRRGRERFRGMVIRLLLGIETLGRQSEVAREHAIDPTKNR